MSLPSRLGAVMMERARRPQRVCPVEDAREIIKVGPAWFRRWWPRLPRRQKHLLYAQGSQALGQGERWKPEGTGCCEFGSGRGLGSGEGPKESKGCPFGAPASDFGLVKPDQPPLCTSGAALRTSGSVPRIGREGALGLQTCGPRRGCGPG